MKKVLDKILEWAKQHKRAAIGAGIGCVVLVAAAVVAVLGVTGVIPTGGNIFGSGDVTRGEWIKMYGEKFGLMNYDRAEPYYTDVKSDSDAFAYVQTFVENGIISGEGEAKLDEKISLEEAYVLLAKNYGGNYVKGVLGNDGQKEDLKNEDWVRFLTENAEVSTERMDKGFSKETAQELLDKVYEHYLNRVFKNVSDIDFAENVIDMSTVTDYEYAGNSLTVSTDKEITEGKVLVLGESKEYIAGVAVKVAKVTGTSKDSNGNNKYELEVSTPELEEVVDSFYVSTSQLVDFEGFEPEEGVSIEEVGTETVGTEYKSKVADCNNILHVDRRELLSVKFNADKKGKFLKLNLNLTEGKISTTAIWEELGYELDTTKAEGFQYTLDEYGKVLSKYDDSGFEVKGSLTLKDLILNGEVGFESGKLTFDFNAGITAEPSLSMVGNIKGKQIKVGSKEVRVCLGCSARFDIYVYVDFEGEVTVKPEFVGLVNVKKKAGKSVNVTGKCESNFQSEIKCELKVKAGPDVVINVWGIGDVLDVYAYMGVGADVTYSATDPLKIVADVYAPTLEAGVSEADNTVLKKMGIKLKVKLIDKEGALFKCPFSARYTYDVLSKDWNSQVGIPDETQGTSENETGGSTEAVGSESGNSGSESAGGTSGGSSSSDSGSGGTGSGTQNANKKYTMSSKTYDYAEYVADDFYVVKVNGKFGAVDFVGNVKVPTIYEDYKMVAKDEAEFVSGNKSYVYNVNTAKQVYSYVNFEYHNYEVVSETKSENEKYYITKKIKQGSIKREYLKGVVCVVTSFEEYVDKQQKNSSNDNGGVSVNTGSGGASDYEKVDIIRISDNKTIYSERSVYISRAEYGYQSALLLNKSDFNNDIVAIFNSYDIENRESYTDIVTISGHKRKSYTYYPSFGVYDGEYVKYCYEIAQSEKGNEVGCINVNTNLKKSIYACWIDDWYEGNGEYFAYSLSGDSTYSLCKGDKVLDTGFTSLDFISDKYIIASKAGKVLFLDYNAKEHMTVKDSSSFYNGKALVYDGTGVYYIDENLNKITDYIYKGSVDDCGTGSVKINGKYHLISQ